jgi:hypothetical protein
MYLILKRDKNFGTEGILNNSTQYSTYGHFGIEYIMYVFQHCAKVVCPKLCSMLCLLFILVEFCNILLHYFSVMNDIISIDE